MMRNKLCGWLLASCTVLPLLVYAQPATETLDTLSGLPVQSVHIKGQHYLVEIASTPAAQTQGLMHRSMLPFRRGMLFVFEDEQPRAFWMKNTLIALDMLFFDQNKQLVAIQENVQPCRADPCPSYPSTVPARYVLELAAGEVKKQQFQLGDVFAIPVP